MKRILLLVLAASLAFSCDQETNLSIAPDIHALAFGPEGGEADVVVFTNGYWKATCDDKSVTFAPDTGNFTTPMHIVVAPNTEKFTKSARISLTTKLNGNGRTSRIAITQTCNPFILCDVTEVQLPSSGGTARFLVNANADWQVVDTKLDGSSVDLAVDPMEHGPNSVTVNVPVSENTTGVQRVYTVTLALKETSSVRLVLTVRQAS